MRGNRSALIFAVLLAMPGCGRKPAPAAGSPKPAVPGPAVSAPASAQEPLDPVRHARLRVASSAALAPLLAWLYDPPTESLRHLPSTLDLDRIAEMLNTSPQRTVEEIDRFMVVARKCQEELAREDALMLQFLEGRYKLQNRPRAQRNDPVDKKDLVAMLVREGPITEEEAWTFLGGR